MLQFGGVTLYIVNMHVTNVTKYLIYSCTYNVYMYM